MAEQGSSDSRQCAACQLLREHAELGVEVNCPSCGTQFRASNGALPSIIPLPSGAASSERISHPAPQNPGDQLTNSVQSPNIFSSDFINSVAASLDDSSMTFRPDGDINFEPDFGQWFSPEDAGGLDGMASSSSSLPGSGPPPPNFGPISLMSSVTNPGNIFSSDFMNSVAASLDEFDANSMFRPDGDINFERDFGQWFNPDDVSGLDVASRGSGIDDLLSSLLDHGPPITARRREAVLDLMLAAAPAVNIWRIHFRRDLERWYHRGSGLGR